MVISAVCWCLVGLVLRSPQFCAGMSNAEGNALIEVKNLLIDRNNALSSWNPDLVSPCSSWSGVVCTDDHVTSVSLAGLGLSGVLSGAIANLTKLQTLTLRNNMISGPLPNALGKLSALETFDAEKNSFNGSIPSSWGTLVKLKFLVLNNNHLTGGIPDSIVNLPSLQSLDLSFNNLTGQIPAGAFKLRSYNFVGNNLTCGLTEPCQSSDSSGNTQKNTTKSNVGKIIGGLVGAVLLVSIVSFAIIRCERERRRLIADATFYDVPAENELRIAFGQLKRFSFRELQNATSHFSEHNVVGQGAFAKVYKGILDDGTEIGVKRLFHINLEGGEAGFLQEVELISVAVHRNLLHLIGYCVTPSERILVYPYMSNKSLAYCLRERKGGEPSLDWKTRKKIALGAARGLEYLHDYCNPKIIHRDVKAANVLLDGDYEPVVGDFGLAKLVDTRNTHVTTEIRGTMGHIAPEYLSTGKSSEKTDVFGYGVMLLELVTGQRAIEMSRLVEDNEVLLLEYVKALHYEKKLETLVDPNLKEYDGRELEQMVQVALLCTQSTAEERPTMGEVVRMLSGEGGLAERWEEWQQVELTRRREFESFPHHLLHLDNYSASYDLEAIQLSSAR